MDQGARKNPSRQWGMEMRQTKATTILRDLDDKREARAFIEAWYLGFSNFPYTSPFPTNLAIPRPSFCSSIGSLSNLHFERESFTLSCGMKSLPFERIRSSCGHQMMCVCARVLIAEFVFSYLSLSVSLLLCRPLFPVVSSMSLDQSQHRQVPLERTRKGLVISGRRCAVPCRGSSKRLSPQLWCRR